MRGSCTYPCAVARPSCTSKSSSLVRIDSQCALESCILIAFCVDPVYVGDLSDSQRFRSQRIHNRQPSETAKAGGRALARAHKRLGHLPVNLITSVARHLEAR